MHIPTRVPLIQLPTPIHRLKFLSQQLGIDLWMKRDDLTGLALGGNKGRKLEYLMAEAQMLGAEAVVTCGALQSNFVRQLAAACSMLGMRCVAAVMNLPYSEEFGKPDVAGLGGFEGSGQAVGPARIAGGNVLLDELFGAELHLFPDDDWLKLYAHAEDLAARLEKEGVRVYRIPVGGSSPLGGYAFFVAAKEIAEQTAPFDFVVTATSSGSTQAGLSYALSGSATKLIGIAADPEPDLLEDVLRVASGLADLLRVRSMGERDVDVRIDWAAPAYGVPSEAGNEAIRLIARTEGIVLDPIYTGKAFAGLLDLARAGEIRGRVLFWHTGGVPAIFANS